MRESITFRPADSVPAATLVDALNQAYRNYYRPLYFTTTSFKAMVAREAIVPDASLVALDGKKIVGMALLGARPPRGWIGGVGVVHPYRRQGIARAMMDHLLDRARGLGLHTVQLEVITLNQAAISLYQSLGFETQRRLLLLTRQPGRPAPLPADGLPHCQAYPTGEALELLDTLDRVTRSWSRDASSLVPLAQQLQAFVALDPESDRPLAVCLYSAQPYQVGLVTLAGSRRAGAALLNTLRAAHPEATISYFNVPADDPLLPELRRAGFRETLAQLEMMRSIQD